MSILQFERASKGLCENDSLYLAHEDVFRAHYRHWRGRSGRSYVFSVYSPEGCPPYEDAVVVVAARGGALACMDLGALPLTTLEALRRRFSMRDDVEFHIHVLADAGADRRALIADLTPDGV